MPTTLIARNEQTRSGDVDDSDEAEEDGFVGADSNGPQVISRLKCDVQVVNVNVSAEY